MHLHIHMSFVSSSKPVLPAGCQVLLNSCKAPDPTGVSEHTHWENVKQRPQLAFVLELTPADWQPGGGWHHSTPCPSSWRCRLLGGAICHE